MLKVPSVLGLATNPNDVRPLVVMKPPALVAVLVEAGEGFVVGAVDDEWPALSGARR